MGSLLDTSQKWSFRHVQLGGGSEADQGLCGNLKKYPGRRVGSYYDSTNTKFS